MFSIRPCSEAEGLSILKDRTVLPFLRFDPAGIKAVETYLMNEAALVIVMPDGPDAEVHIACKRRDRAFLREAFTEGLQWLKSRGFKRVWTTAPDNRIALTNMLKSLRFENVAGKWIWE